MSKQEKNYKKSKSRKLYFMLQVIFLIIFIQSSIEVIRWYINNEQSRKINMEINRCITRENDEEGKAEAKYNIDFTSLKKINEDAIAFLKVNGTNIEYVVVQGKDNEYYLEHSFNKANNKAGWIFADYKNRIDGTDKNLIIYGHNRKDDSMFGTLENVLKEEWYNNKDNRKIILITEKETYVYEVFSVYQVKVQEDYLQKYFYGNEFNDFIKKIKSLSNTDFDVDVVPEDNILTLSTCADNSKYRIVLHAKQLR